MSEKFGTDGDNDGDMMVFSGGGGGALARICEYLHVSREEQETHFSEGNTFVRILENIARTRGLPS